MFADCSGFSDGRGAGQAAIAWEPRSGRLGLLAQPMCPLGYACKPALDIQVTGSSIPVGTECGFPFPTCSHFSYNEIRATARIASR